jgi:hypothetical protein
LDSVKVHDGTKSKKPTSVTPGTRSTHNVRDRQEANGRSHPAGWYTTNYAVIDLWRDKLVEWSDLDITIDAFANKTNRRFRRFWSLKNNAFLKSWTKEILWCNPPFHLILEVIEKIILSQAQALLIVPRWTHLRW